jgi:hypothetical protein
MSEARMRGSTRILVPRLPARSMRPEGPDKELLQSLY